MSIASKALLIFFWVAFAAFLSASIPHVAWFFSVFEPVDGPNGWLYWFVSYAIAVSIDVTVFLLSMTVASLVKQGKSKGLIVSVWCFILALACLSWWINAKYSVHFERPGVIAPSPVSLPLWFTTLQIADLNPVIASCFQILAVAYTYISDKIAAGEAPKTAEELEKEVRELEAKRKIQTRLKELNKGRIKNGLLGVIDDSVDVGKHLAKHLKKEHQNGDTAFSESASNGPDTGELEAFNLAPSDDEQGNQTTIQSPLAETPDAPESDHQSDRWGGFTSHSTVSLEKAAEMLNVGINRVKDLRKRGLLKTASKNADLITIASLKAYTAGRSKRRQTTAKKENKPHLKVVGE